MAQRDLGYFRSSRSWTCGALKCTKNDAADGTHRKLVPEGDASSSPGLLSAAAESYPGFEFTLIEAITPMGLRPAKPIFGVDRIEHPRRPKRTSATGAHKETGQQLRRSDGEKRGA